MSSGSLKWRAAVAAALLLCGAQGVSAGPMSAPSLPPASTAEITPVQYYGPGPYPYWRRPYGYYRGYGYYRPYGYGPRPWLYGPGAAKQRYRTRLDFCKNQPQRC